MSLFYLLCHGLLALLSEPDPSLVSHALTKLLSVVDALWHEVAEALPDLEAIAEGGARIEQDGDVEAGRGQVAEDRREALREKENAACLSSFRGIVVIVCDCFPKVGAKLIISNE